MNSSERTCEALIKHYQQYPKLQIQDVLKFIHQSAFGCEHLIASPVAAAEYIQTEYENRISSAEAARIEPLDGEYSRVHLSCMHQGLSAQTLGRLLFESAKTEENGKKDTEEKLQIALSLVEQKKLPFSVSEFKAAMAQWKSEGYPAVHHSDTFRTAYHPAYRVIANHFIPFLPLFTKLDQALQKGPTTLAIEGGSASGKSTLSATLEKLYNATVLHMDDFFLRPEQRTPERYAEVGGNIDYERFAKEVLAPLAERKPFAYRKFDCATFSLSAPHSVTPNKLVVVEGVYSMHPKFGKYFDASVFLNVSPDLQQARIAKRNPPHIAELFHKTWIPLENLYFSKMQIQSRCDMTIEIQN